MCSSCFKRPCHYTPGNIYDLINSGGAPSFSTGDVLTLIVLLSLYCLRASIGCSQEELVSKLVEFCAVIFYSDTSI